MAAAHDIYYALGGGLGHLTRARSVLYTLGLRARVLTLSPYAADPRVAAGLGLLLPPALHRQPAAFGPWLTGLLQRLRPRTLYLDCFPAGLFGELDGLAAPPGLRIELLARRLRWEAYAPLLGERPPPLHRVHLLEALAPPHAAWLAARCTDLRPLALRPPPLPLHPGVIERVARLPRPRWLVIHSGPTAELRELLAYARDLARAEGATPRLALVTPDYAGPLDGVPRIAAYPARPLLPLADRIVTACGFNLMQETLPWRTRHHFLPLPRRFDDQYARAAQARATP